MRHFEPYQFTFAGRVIRYIPFCLPAMGLTLKKAHEVRGGVRIEAIEVEGSVYQYTDRFGGAFGTLLRQSANIFKLFTPDEVIARALETKQVEESALLIADVTDEGKWVALGVTPLERQFLNLGHIAEFAEKAGATLEIKGIYDGAVHLEADLTRISSPFDVGGIRYSPAMLLQIPFDGWGKPCASLAVSSSAPTMVAGGSGFRTQANVGTKAEGFVFSLQRFAESFSNDDGFALIKQRLEHAEISYASLGEMMELGDVLQRCSVEKEVAGDWFKLVRNSCVAYHISDLSGLSPKRLVRVASKATVHDLLMFAAKAAATAKTPQGIHAWIGNLICDQGGFDLEGSRKAMEEKAG